MHSRRDFGKLALATAPLSRVAFARIDSTFHGVKIGAQSYSFRDRSLDEAIKAMKEIGLGYTELYQGHIEPKGMSPDAMKKWRASDEPLKLGREAKSKFDDAGIQIYAFNYSFRKEHSDEEVLRGMEMAKAMGTKYITASSTVDQAARLNNLARKAGVYVAMHNHDKSDDPNEYATPESFAKALEGNDRILINLDIGHFTAANYDAVQYLQEHHKRIVTLHIKDRKKNHGPNVPFGQGDTPIKEVLTVLKTRKYNIPAMIEYEYKGADTVAEVKKCFEYMKEALA